MSGTDFDPGAVAALVAAAIAVVAAAAILRARSLLAIALMLAVLGAALAVSFLALDAPDMALIEALLGGAFIPLIFIAAMLLTTPSVRRRPGKARLGALVAALAVGAGLIWAATDLPTFGGGDANQGRIYVSRALGESGVRNAVAGVAGNYRALDTFAQIVALMGAGLGAYALLGFGERAGGRRRKTEEGGP
jgi:uncharacterized MnhB-related membrane protein